MGLGKVKDLIVYIPTRSNPEGLSRTLSMMYDNCTSISNFDILVIVDKDQVGMYKEAKDRTQEFNNIIWSYPEHDSNDWWNIFSIKNEFLKVNSYYFDALWTDDFVGLSPNWDKDIVSKKHYFEDDIFTLHQSKDGGGHQRKLSNYKKCYGNSSREIWICAESLPVTTRRLSLMINEVIKPNYLTSQFEMLIAAVIMILYTEHGHNRLINGDFFWDRFDTKKKPGTLSSTYIGLDGFIDKRSSFDNWTHIENYSVIRPIVEKINGIIKDE